MKQHLLKICELYHIAEFIKAKYNKYCPKIDWNDEGNNN